MKNEGWYRPTPRGVWHYFDTRPGMAESRVMSLCGSFLIATLDSGKPSLESDTRGEERCRRCERLRVESRNLRNETAGVSPAWSAAFRKKPTA